MSYRVKFVCPKCRHTQIDEVVKVFEHVPVNTIMDDGYICEYGTASYTSIMGETSDYKCGNCNWHLRLFKVESGNGLAGNTMKSLLKWLKENNMLE